MRTLEVWVMAAALAACGGRGSALQTGLPASFVGSGDARGDLLYISDNEANEVFVYTYPQLKLRATLTGFEAPNGECADKRGDVFITNLEAHDILEYRHGDGRLLATLEDGENHPIDCSVDAVTGNLAVTNIGLFGSQEGNVAIYKAATGAPDSVFQFWIENDRVIAPDSGGSGDVRLYRYPAGGSPQATLSHFVEPAGATISLAAKR